MDTDKVEQLIEVHNDKSTEELKAITLEYHREGLDNKSPLILEDFEAISQILKWRGIDTDKMVNEALELRYDDIKRRYRKRWWQQDFTILIPIIVIGLCIWMFKSCEENGLILGFPLVVGFMMLKWIWEDWLSEL